MIIIFNVLVAIHTTGDGRKMSVVISIAVISNLILVIFLVLSVRRFIIQYRLVDEDKLFLENQRRNNRNNSNNTFQKQISI